MWDERGIRRFAAAHRGLIDRKTALRYGATDDVIGRQVLLGRWKALHDGVYYLNAVNPGWRAQVQAAVMAAGEPALASHRTAAVLCGLDGFTTRVIELTVPYDGRPQPTGVIVHRTRRQLPSSLVAGIPTTSVERILLDLSPMVPEMALEKAYMSALRQRLTTPELVACLVTEQGGPGVRGTKKMRRVLATADEGISGSAAEVEMARIIRWAPIPSPALQFQIRLPNGENAYPDFSWPDRMKVVEVDGFGAHSTPDQLHRDLIRQNMLMEMGWEIRRFSARQVRRESQAVLAEIVRFVAD